MKKLVIPDLHWKDVWKQVVKNWDWKVIFLWDYVDDYPPTTDEQIISNITDIISFKKENPNRVHLLLGNHDIQYIYPFNKCSWYRESYYEQISNLFYDNLDLFQFTHREGNYVFSHAWISEWWLEHNWLTLEQVLSVIPNEWYIDWWFFDVWALRWWMKTYWWPFWADKIETQNSESMPKWIQQVAGHTKVNDIIIFPHIIYTDCLDSKINFLKLE